MRGGVVAADVVAVDAAVAVDVAVVVDNVAAVAVHVVAAAENVAAVECIVAAAEHLEGEAGHRLGPRLAPGWGVAAGHVGPAVSAEPEAVDCIGHVAGHGGSAGYADAGQVAGLGQDSPAAAVEAATTEAEAEAEASPSQIQDENEAFVFQADSRQPCRPRLCAVQTACVSRKQAVAAVAASASAVAAVGLPWLQLTQGTE